MHQEVKEKLMEKQKRQPNNCCTPLKNKAHAMKRLNNRPRKRLGFKTYNQVFFGDKLNFALTI